VWGQLSGRVCLVVGYPVAFTAGTIVTACEGDTVTFTLGPIVVGGETREWCLGSDGNWKEAQVNPDIEHMTFAEIKKLIARKDEAIRKLNEDVAYAVEGEAKALKDTGHYRNLILHGNLPDNQRAELEKLRRFRLAVDGAYNLSEA
jgi:hypothetical protein